jgi:hypothetical protein
MNVHMKILPLLVAMAVGTTPSVVYSDIPEFLNQPTTTTTKKKSNTCLKAEAASEKKKSAADAALQNYRKGEAALRAAKSALRDAERDVRTITAQKANTVKLLDRQVKDGVKAANAGRDSEAKLHQAAADKSAAKLRQ